MNQRLPFYRVYLGQNTVTRIPFCKIQRPHISTHNRSFLLQRGQKDGQIVDTNDLSFFPFVCSAPRSLSLRTRASCHPTTCTWIPNTLNQNNISISVSRRSIAYDLAWSAGPVVQSGKPGGLEVDVWVLGALLVLVPIAGFYNKSTQLLIVHSAHNSTHPFLSCSTFIPLNHRYTTTKCLPEQTEES